MCARSIADEHMHEILGRVSHVIRQAWTPQSTVQLVRYGLERFACTTSAAQPWLIAASMAVPSAALSCHPFSQWIMHHGLQHAHERVAIIAQNAHGNLRRLSKSAFDASDAECIGHVVRETERHTLGDFKKHAFLKQAIEVNMYCIA